MFRNTPVRMAGGQAIPFSLLLPGWPLDSFDVQIFWSGFVLHFFLVLVLVAHQSQSDQLISTCVHLPYNLYILYKYKYGYGSKNGYGSLCGDPDLWNEGVT